jgi:small-conductance mechanosensitive channel
LTPTLLPAAILVALAIAGTVIFRRFSDRVRIVFDAVCFLAISIYLLDQSIAPVFPPLSSGPVESHALWVRAVAGAWWWFGARLVGSGLGFALRRDPHSREARLFSDLSAAAIYIATAAVVFNSVFALPVTGVVATSGVVAIVLGLALQNTLADVFAGVAVGVEAPFGVGDRVLIGDKIEGRIVQVNWRSTRVQTDGDDIAIIPNSVVARAEIVNRSFPSQRRAASVEISCPERAIPERVIESLLHATLLCPAILRELPPSAVLVRMGANRNVYEISFVVARTDQLATTKDLLLRGARRQLHYAGLLDRSSDRPAAAGSGQPGGSQSRSSQSGSIESHSNLSGEATAVVRRLLGDLVLFESLGPDQVGGLASHLESLRLEPGQPLFHEGAEDTSLYVVASGVLEFTRQGEGGSEIIGCIGAGEYVGEIGLLTGAPHAATAIARTYCQIFRLPREALAPLLSANTALAATFDRSVRHGLEILHRDVAVRATPSLGPAGQLLVRIRAIFHLGPG